MMLPWMREAGDIYTDGPTAGPTMGGAPAPAPAPVLMINPAAFHYVTSVQPSGVTGVTSNNGGATLVANQGGTTGGTGGTGIDGYQPPPATYVPPPATYVNSFPVTSPGSTPVTSAPSAGSSGSGMPTWGWVALGGGALLAFLYLGDRDKRKH